MDIPSLILIRLVRDGSISDVGPLEMDPSLTNLIDIRDGMSIMDPYQGWTHP